MHGDKRDQARLTPHYKVLVNSKKLDSRYAAQYNLQKVSRKQVENPHLWDYFDSYSSIHNRYIPRDGLKAIDLED